MSWDLVIRASGGYIRILKCGYRAGDKRNGLRGTRGSSATGSAG